MTGTNSDLKKVNETQVTVESGKRSESQAPPTMESISPSRIFREPKIIFNIFKNTYAEFSKDNVVRMSAALAYYTIFSIAPLLVIAIAIAAIAFGQKAAEGALMGQIQGFVGQDSAKAIQTMVQSAQRPAHGTVATIIGLAALLWGASSVFAEMHDALNTIWDVDVKAESGIWNLIKTRFLSFGMVLAIGFLLLVSLLLSASLAGLSKYLENRLGVPAVLFHALDMIVSVIVVATLFAMIFRFLPGLKVPWKNVWVGAILTSVLFTLGKLLIGLYIGKSISASAYGAAAAILVIVAWVYYSTLILYFGAEFTHVYSNQFADVKS